MRGSANGMNSFPLSSLPPAGSKNAIKLVFMNPPQDMAQKPDLLFSHEYDIFLAKKEKKMGMSSILGPDLSVLAE